MPENKDKLGKLEISVNGLKSDVALLKKIIFQIKGVKQRNEDDRQLEELDNMIDELE